MFEFNLVKPSDGSKCWHMENNKPDIGIYACFIDFGNPKVLGQSYSIAPFIEVPLNEKEKKSRVIFRLSWGLAYLTKKFDVETNHKNVAIGSHWNAFIQYRFLWHLNINEKLRLEPGIGISHASNGRAQVPNLGLNLISGSLGLTYKLSSLPKDVKVTDSCTRAPSRHELMAWYGIGMNEKDPPGGKKLMAHTFSIQYHFNRRNTHKFGAGADLFAEQIYLQDLKDNSLPANTFLEKIRIGPKFCYSYNIGRMSLPIEVGYYALSQVNSDGPVFSRFGIRYTGPKGLVVNFSLKTHFAIAHHFEAGFGYRLPLKKRVSVKG